MNQKETRNALNTFKALANIQGSIPVTFFLTSQPLESLKLPHSVSPGVKAVAAA